MFWCTKVLISTEEWSCQRIWEDQHGQRLQGQAEINKTLHGGHLHQIDQLSLPNPSLLCTGSIEVAIAIVIARTLITRSVVTFTHRPLNGPF